MDAFYAAVEQNDRPELRGKPLIIGSPSKRGVVTTASYEARFYGVRSAMPMVEAMRRCPHAVILSPEMSRYAAVSREIMDVFLQFTPLLEPLSVDEAFLDMSGSRSLFGSPEEMAVAIKAAVKARTGLTVSIGGAPTKYVAKVASDINKPDGMLIIRADEVLDFLWPLPLSRLWGVGPKTEQRLQALGLRRIGELAKSSKAILEAELGSLGERLHQLANGVDPRPVIAGRGAHSVGSERTLEEDIRGREAIWPHLIHAADEVAYRLRKKKLLARGVRVKLKTHRFELISRQAQLRSPSANAGEFLALARELLGQFDLRRAYRLVGLAAFDLTELKNRQGSLFDERPEPLDETMDEIKRRFGSQALRRASDFDPKRRQATLKKDP